MGELDQYDEATLRAAYRVRAHIFLEGIEAARFMKSAELWAEDNAADITARKISQELNKL